jgi:GAF domain-containing protein
MADIRAFAGVEWALLLVVELPSKEGDTASHDPRLSKVFQSLLLLAHRRPSREKQWQRLLVENAAALQRPCARTKLEALLKVIGRKPFCVTKIGAGILLPLDAVITDTGLPNYSLLSSRITNGIAPPVVVAVAIPQEHNMKQQLEPIKDRLLYLAAMVHASEPLVVHRGLSLARRVDQTIKMMEADSPVRQDSHLSEADGRAPSMPHILGLAKATIAAATSLTRSKFGDLCLTDREPAELYVVAHCELADPGAKRQGGNSNEHLKITTPFERLTGAEPLSVVPFVYSTGRPFFVNDLREFNDMHPRLQYQYVRKQPNGGRRSPRVAELAVPITVQEDPLQRPRVIGVLNLEKYKGAYTLDDLTIARTLSQHFCLRRIELLSAVAHRSVAALTMAQSQPRPPILEAVTAIRSGLHPKLIDPVLQWPIEFELSRPEIEHALKTLYEISRSTHVTVRLLDVGQTSLYRFAEWPPAYGRPELSAIPIRLAFSANAWVARHARICHVRNVDNKAEFRSYEGLQAVIKPFAALKSEYCLPIIWDQRVVGTIDLESQFVDAFGGDQKMINALAEQIRLSFRSAQRTFEHELILANATSNLSAHEILKCSDQMELLRNTLPEKDKIRRQLDDVRDRLRRVVANIRSSPVDKIRDSPVSLSRLIQDTCALHHVGSWCRVHNDRSIAELSIKPLAAHYLGLALGEVLDNAFRELTRVRNAEIHIWLDDAERYGRSYIGLTIVNPIQVGRDLPLDVERRLFRVPFTTDRWHLGAYLAGLAIRSIGGDIRAIYNAEKHRVNTLIEVPRSWTV